ncbi:MAG: phasin family protein [Chitinophagales bacterium]
MEESFKKLLYAGVGLAAQATEKLQKSVDELVEKGKMTDSEAKKVVEDFLDKSDSKKDEFEDRFNSFVEKFGYTKSEELDALKKRIAELEKKSGSSSSSTASTAKKATASK